MHPRLLVPIGLFAAGVALISLAVASGEAEVSLFLIFPVFSGSGAMFLVGTVLILLSFVVGFILLSLGQHELAVSSLPWTERDAGGDDLKTGAKTKYGGVILLGPIPIAFGSDKKTALAMLVIGIVVVAVLLLLVLLSL